MTGEVKRKYIKIIGGGLVGIEIAYILARNGFCVHIFNKNQPLMCHIERRIALKNELDAELSAFDSPTYLLSKRLGVNVENIDGEFVDMVREKLKTFPNLSFVDAEIDELNYNELTLLCTGNNTTKNRSRHSRLTPIFLSSYLPKAASTRFNKAGISNPCGHLDRHWPQFVQDEAGSPRWIGDIDVV